MIFDVKNAKHQVVSTPRSKDADTFAMVQSGLGPAKGETGESLLEKQNRKKKKVTPIWKRMAKWFLPDFPVRFICFVSFVF